MVEAGGARARIAAALEAPIRALGWLCGWLVLACVLLTFAVVLVRYGLGRPALAAQELVLHLNAVVVLVGGAWALVRDQHVRVDIFKQRWSPVVQDRVELAGIALLLLPFGVFLFWISLDYVGASWGMREGSREVGGLPGVFLVKTLIPVSAVLLILAGVARGLRMLARVGSDAPTSAAASAMQDDRARPSSTGGTPLPPAGAPGADDIVTGTEYSDTGADYSHTGADYSDPSADDRGPRRAGP